MNDDIASAIRPMPAMWTYRTAHCCENTGILKAAGAHVDFFHARLSFLPAQWTRRKKLFVVHWSSVLPRVGDQTRDATRMTTAGLIHSGTVFGVDAAAASYAIYAVMKNRSALIIIVSYQNLIDSSSHHPPYP